MNFSDSSEEIDNGALRGERSLIEAPPGSFMLLILLAVAAFGAWLGNFLIMHAPDAARIPAAHADALRLWAGLIGGLCGYGFGACAVMGLWLYRQLRVFGPRVSPLSWVRWAIVTMLVFALVKLIMAGIPAGSVHGQPIRLFVDQIGYLTIAGFISTIPGFVGFLAVGSFARNEVHWHEEPHSQVLLAVTLRRQLRRLLTTFGLFLTLFVVTTDTRRQLVLTIYPNASYAKDYALLLGVVLAAVLALFHISASTALNWRCETLLDTYTAIPDPHADDASARLSQRRDLAVILGVDWTQKQTFQNALIVLAPLLTALIGTVLP